ncbi:MAG: glycoside hydrolase family 3 C-terminal domain-containing protein [Chitinophagaceae bacterium]|nr:glycoside hydrolase family 3 C-terminal domain-containing protein [Chitinophagaceae bacterium]
MRFVHPFQYVPLTFLFFLTGSVFQNSSAQKKTIDQKVDSVLQLMTLEEKAGQLNQYTGDWSFTGPVTNDNTKIQQVKEGKLGSMLNVVGVEKTKLLQQYAMQSRLKIPLLFGQDVIHGFRTTFPLPLAEAASWDLEAVELSARIAAIEASAAGVHWTFAPMVDISRDPRWGRVMEGAGEDTYLGSLIARARVKGFQGKGLGNINAVMACAKHFAAYGAAVGGRDYNSVDMSPRMLWETYLPPFLAAKEAGAATFMNSFNDLNGIPATGNRYLQRDILKGKWKFNGFVVSDWSSVGEMIAHGFAKDTSHAAQIAINAGSDMDMESRAYIKHLPQLVREGKVKIEWVDDAVRRILRKKFELGLFDDPFKYSNEQRQQQQWNNPQHIAAAREMAKKSIVLLKNQSQTLPLKANQKIALIGPFVKAVKDNLGFWSMEWEDDSTRIVPLWNGMMNKVDKANLLYAKGCNINDADTSGFAAAIETAKQSDIVIMTIGEARDMSGEAKSRSSLQLPGVQNKLIAAIAATGKPIILLIHAGRPLIFDKAASHASAILYTWWLGTEAGNAIADVLYGDYNPSGKLPMTFPRTEGQIPIYYNHYSTGRPAEDEFQNNYVSAYIDLPNSPAYPFGYGLSYTSFAYAHFKLSSTTLKGNQTLTASVTLTNTGNFKGKETVQLYIRDLVGKVIRPVKELKGFKQVELNPGESKVITFTITTNDLRFYDDQLRFDWEAGEFEIMIGSNSKDVQVKKISWTK